MAASDSPNLTPEDDADELEELDELEDQDELDDADDDAEDEDDLDEDDDGSEDDEDEDELEDDDDAPEPGNSARGPLDDLTAFVEFMVANLVDDPSVVTIRPEQFGSNVHIKVVVPEEEMGRVIGRNGRIARSMRTLLTIAASRKGLRASLDIDS